MLSIIGKQISSFSLFPIFTCIFPFHVEIPTLKQLTFLIYTCLYWSVCWYDFSPFCFLAMSTQNTHITTYNISFTCLYFRPSFILAHRLQHFLYLDLFSSVIHSPSLRPRLLRHNSSILPPEGECGNTNNVGFGRLKKGKDMTWNHHEILLSRKLLVVGRFTWKSRKRHKSIHHEFSNSNVIRPHPFSWPDKEKSYYENNLGKKDKYINRFFTARGVIQCLYISSGWT